MRTDLEVVLFFIGDVNTYSSVNTATPFWLRPRKQSLETHNLKYFELLPVVHN